MATDEPPFITPGLKPTPRPRPAGERLFEFVRESDRAHFVFGLLFHGQYDRVEVQIYMNGKTLMGRMFTMKADAFEWAVEERKAIEQGGM